MQSAIFPTATLRRASAFLPPPSRGRAHGLVSDRGARRPDEALSTDVALIGDAKAERLLIMTSATHGAEGFCGSGCQLALLDDAPMLLARARFRRGTAAGARGQSLWLFVDRAHRRGQRRPEPPMPSPSMAVPCPRTPATARASVAAARVLAADRSQPARAGALHRRAWPAATPRPSRAGSTMPTACSPGGDRPAASLLNMRHPEEHAADFSSIGWIGVLRG